MADIVLCPFAFTFYTFTFLNAFKTNNRTTLKTEKTRIEVFETWCRRRALQITWTELTYFNRNGVFLRRMKNRFEIH